MKKIFPILLSFISVTAFAQQPAGSATGVVTGLKGVVTLVRDSATSVFGGCLFLETGTNKVRVRPCGGAAAYDTAGNNNSVVTIYQLNNLADTIRLKNAGSTGDSLAYVNSANATAYFRRLNFSTGLSVVHNADTSLTITSSGGATNWYNVTSYGLVNDSVTDNTAALRTMRDAIPNGATMFFPGGGKGYSFSDTVTFKGRNIQMIGVGMGGDKVFEDSVGAATYPTVLYFNSSTKNFLVFDTSALNTNPNVTIRDLAIVNNASSLPTAGSAIVVKDNVNSMVFESVRVRRFWIDLNLISTYYWYMNNCRIVEPVKYGISLGNTIDSDLGDWSLSNSIFESGKFPTALSSAFIYWQAGGGGKIIGNKFNSNGYNQITRMKYDIIADFNQGPTSDVIIEGNSFENYDTTALYFNNKSAGLISHIQIHNNQFSPVDNKGSAKEAIYINNFHQVDIDGVVGRNYLGAIHYAMIRLINNVDVTVGSNIMQNDWDSIYALGGANPNAFISYNVAATHTEDNQLKVNTFGIQNLGVNATLLNENLVYNGGYTRIAAGAGENLWMGNVDMGFQVAPSGAAGTSASPTFPLRTNQTAVGLGGSVTSPTTFSGASMIINRLGTGQVQLTSYGAGSFTGTPITTANFDASGNIIEGQVPSAASFTPTFTYTTNITSGGSGPISAFYQKIGNIVHVRIAGSLTSTAANTATVLTISLPFTTSSTTQFATGPGVVSNNSGASYTSGVFDIVSGTTGQFKYISGPVSAVSGEFTLEFTYTL